MTDAILIGIVLAPAAMTFLFKSNAALGFLTLCLSFVLSTSVIGDLKNLLSQMDLSLTESSIAVIVLVVPLLLTLLFTHRASTSGIKFYLQLIIALAAGGLLSLSLEPVLNWRTSANVTSAGLWQYLHNLQSIIIGIGGCLSLFLVWSGAGKHAKKRHK